MTSLAIPGLINFEVTQHQEFITSFWIVGKNGHSDRTVLDLPYQKQQLTATEWKTWSVHSFTAPTEKSI